MSSTLAPTDQISQRISNLEESATLAMAAKAREYRAQGIEVIALSLGEPDFKTPTHICEGAKRAIDEGKYFSYPPVNGYLDLRQAICQKLERDNKINYTPEQIVVSNGAKQSIANAMFSLVDPGDEVITVAAGFPTTLNPILQYRCIPVFVDVDPQTLNIDANQLEAALSPHRWRGLHLHRRAKLLDSHPTPPRPVRTAAAGSLRHGDSGAVSWSPRGPSGSHRGPRASPVQ